jgi:drug/metabolite transporter (DMT)-like permease
MVHQIGPRASIMQLALVRSLAGLTVVAILAYRLRGIGWWIIKTNQLALQLLRGFISLGYLWVMMFSFAWLPFADATAISYTQAAYIAGFSMLILHERVTLLRWAAAMIGFAGAALIVRPALLDWNVAYLVALFGTSLNGLAFVLNKFLQRPDGDSELTTMFFVNLVPGVCNLPVLATLPLLPLDVWLWLSGVLLFGPVGMYLGIVAVRHASASTLGPYTFLRLVIAVIAGVVIFREIPNFVGFLGVVLILLSCLFAVIPNIRREPPKNPSPAQFPLLQRAMHATALSTRWWTAIDDKFDAGIPARTQIRAAAQSTVTRKLRNAL